MATLLIRNLDDRTKARLRKRAAKNGHSMAQEAREVLARELARVESEEEHLVDRIRRRIESSSGGGDIPLMPRTPMPPPLTFD
jgi:plasmid stability protein